MQPTRTRVSRAYTWDRTAVAIIERDRQSLPTRRQNMIVDFG